MAELLQVDCEMFGLSSDHYSVTLRRYAGMALTNLTFGDVANKVGTEFSYTFIRHSLLNLSEMLRQSRNDQLCFVMLQAQEPIKSQHCLFTIRPHYAR